MPFMEKKKRNATHLATTKNLYSNFNTNQLYPATIQIKSGIQSSFEDRIYFNKYDSLGNILEQQKTNDVVSSYIWGYKGSYPIAQVVNASSDKVAYTSFESDNTGNWNFTGTGFPFSASLTGKNVYTLMGDITKSGLGTGSYIVSYWKQVGPVTVNGGAGVAGETINGWTYYEHTITDPPGGTITVTGGLARIDELRLYPVGSQMTTYTYSPLVGVISQCDPNNLITYYDYDSFGRLYLVKDNKGNIVKHNVYNIQTSEQ